MVKKQQHSVVHVAHVGGLTSLFSSSNRKQNATPSSSSSSSSSMLSSSSPSSVWQWTACALRPRTLSFRQQQQQEEAEEMVDADGHSRHQQDHDGDHHTSVDSCVSIQSSASDDVNDSVSTAAAEAEAVIFRALRSDRILYDDEPDAEDASCMLIKPKLQVIMEDEKDTCIMSTKNNAAAASAMTTAVAFGGATAMSVESQDPYRDFRESMEAMVMSQQVQVAPEGEGDGVKDWRWLEDMLGWYIKANAKSTHGVIVAAFVDLLLALTASPADAPGYYSSSSSSPPATPPAAAAAAFANDCSASSSTDCCSCSCSSSSTSL